MVQWLGLCTLIAKGLVSTPGWGTKILQALWLKKKKKKWAKEKKKGRVPKKRVISDGDRMQKGQGHEAGAHLFPEEWRRGAKEWP